MFQGIQSARWFVSWGGGVQGYYVRVGPADILKGVVFGGQVALILLAGDRGKAWRLVLVWGRGAADVKLLMLLFVLLPLFSNRRWVKFRLTRLLMLCYSNPVTAVGISCGMRFERIA